MQQRVSISERAIHGSLAERVVVVEKVQRDITDEIKHIMGEFSRCAPIDLYMGFDTEKSTLYVQNNLHHRVFEIDWFELEKVTMGLSGRTVYVLRSLGIPTYLD